MSPELTSVFISSQWDRKCGAQITDFITATAQHENLTEAFSGKYVDPCSNNISAHIPKMCFGNFETNWISHDIIQCLVVVASCTAQPNRLVKVGKTVWSKTSREEPTSQRVRSDIRFWQLKMENP